MNCTYLNVINIDIYIDSLLSDIAKFYLLT